MAWCTCAHHNFDTVTARTRPNAYNHSSRHRHHHKNAVGCLRQRHYGILDRTRASAAASLHTPHHLVETIRAQRSVSTQPKNRIGIGAFLMRNIPILCHLEVILRFKQYTHTHTHTKWSRRTSAVFEFSRFGPGLGLRIEANKQKNAIGRIEKNSSRITMAFVNRMPE